MNKQARIVITGGPCSGKTTLFYNLLEYYKDEVTPVPEVATLLLKSGHPMPGREIEWSRQWQDEFQKEVLKIQRALEKPLSIRAKNSGSMLICDRGILDGATFFDGGVPEFADRFDIDIQKSINQYDLVLHLDSLASISPDKYLMKADNEERFHDLESAKEISARVADAWIDHPNRHHISELGIDRVTLRAIEIIDDLNEG